MATFRRKYFKGHCESCEQVTKQVYVGEGDKDEVVLRCNKCSAVNTFSIDRVLKTGRVLTEEEFEERKQALSEVVAYRPEDTYWRGQKIHHPVFDDVGEVVDKVQTAGAHSVIVVKFEKEGTKKLLEDTNLAEAENLRAV